MDDPPMNLLAFYLGKNYKRSITTFMWIYVDLKLSKQLTNN